MNINEFLNKGFEIRDQIHYWHLQTKIYSEHKILNKFYKKWIKLLDSFIETYQGRYVNLKGNSNIELEPYYENSSIDYLNKILLFLQSDARKLLYQGQDSDLNAILDEMQGLVSHTLYFLKME
jgi:hypothetical protein